MYIIFSNKQCIYIYISHALGDESGECTYDSPLPEMNLPQGGDLVLSLPVGVSKIWMEMGTFTPQMGADGVWPYGYAFKIARHYGYNI